MPIALAIWRVCWHEWGLSIWSLVVIGPLVCFRVAGRTLLFEGGCGDG
jgi:hypothetical protein